MFILTVHNKRWRIQKDGQIVYSGIGSTLEALAIAKANGVVLSKITKLNYIRAA